MHILSFFLGAQQLRESNKIKENVIERKSISQNTDISLLNIKSRDIRILI